MSLVSQLIVRWGHSPSLPSCLVVKRSVLGVRLSSRTGAGVSIQIAVAFDVQDCLDVSKRIVLWAGMQVRHDCQITSMNSCLSCHLPSYPLLLVRVWFPSKTSCAALSVPSEP